MVDYSQHKVPDLKKILQERGLGVSGNKADLIARLQEDDKKGTTAGGEDEIDWDDDDNKAVEQTPAAPVEATNPPVEAPKTTPAPTPIVEPQPVANTAAKVAPAAAEDVKVTAPETKTTEAEAEKPEAAPKVNYTLGVEATDAEKEAEKRAARAKKFGIVVAPVEEDDAAKKLAERAKKFGLDTTSAKEAVVSGLDSALPERKLKRGREERQPQGGRNAKRQTPDRRTEAKGKPTAAAPAPPPPAKKAIGRILDDPSEKAKAEARAKKFGAAPKA